MIKLDDSQNICYIVSGPLYRQLSQRMDFYCNQCGRPVFESTELLGKTFGLIDFTSLNPEKYPKHIPQGDDEGFREMKKFSKGWSCAFYNEKWIYIGYGDYCVMLPAKWYADTEMIAEKGGFSGWF